MLFLGFLFAYILPWLLGWGIIALVDRRRQLSTGFRFFCAFPLGAGLFTLQLLIAGATGLNLILPVCLAILILDFAAVYALARYFKVRIFPEKFPAFGPVLEKVRLFRRSEKILIAALALLLCAKLISASYTAAYSPVYDFDAWNDWNLRAKVIYFNHALPLDRASQFYLGGGYTNYPLNDGLWKAWTATAMGTWQDGWVDQAGVIFYAVLAGFFFFSLPAAWKFSWRLLFSYLFTGLPFVFFHASVPYADLEFSVYVFISLISFYQFLQNRLRPHLLLSALALGLAIWTKAEGLMVLAPVIFAVSVFLLAFRRLRLKIFLEYWTAALAAAAPWLVFRIFAGLLNFFNGGAAAFVLGFHSRFLAIMADAVFLGSHFNFLWLLVFPLLFFSLKKIWKDRALLFLAACVVALFFLYNGVTLFTDLDNDLTGYVRANLQLAPAALFMCFLLLESYLPQISTNPPEALDFSDTVNKKNLL